MIQNLSGKKAPVLIKKASGEVEEFSTEKLERSLLNAGAKKDTVYEIVSHIHDWIYPGISTKAIYSRAFSLLRKEKTSSSLRYKLKKAILEMGPTGYPFEALIGELFHRQGFEIEVGIIVEGHCVSHEMDVIASKDQKMNLVECKYHKDQGRHVSIQVPLYVKSRVEDIVNKRKENPDYKNYSFKAWVVTNTRFSEDSIGYASCSGMELLGWDYPNGNGLKERLEKFSIYPVTVLNNLTIKEKRQLMEEGIVSCSQLSEKKEVLKELNMNPRKYKNLLKELHDIIS